MTWETQASGRRYYTRSTRINGKIHRHYVGGGDRAEQAAQEDLDNIRARRARREQLKARRQIGEAFDEPFKTFDALVTRAMRRTLIDNGYHQHQRGEWRKQRHSAAEMIDEEKIANDG